MNFETLSIATKGVLTNRMRSALTMLGILIGVASVVVLVAVGNGSSIAVANQFKALGTNSISVAPRGGRGGGPGGGGGGGGSSATPITLGAGDVKALQNKQYASVIKSVIPLVDGNNVTAAWQGTSTQPSRVVGATAEYEEAGAYSVKSGRFFNDNEVTNRLPVVVIGQTTATNLFGTSQAVGQIIQMNHVNFTVVGLLKDKGSNGFQDLDDVALAPWTAIRDRITGGPGYDDLAVEATSSKTTDAAQSVVTNVLAQRNGRNPNNTNTLGFRVRNATSLIQSSTSTSHTLTVLLGAVAAISLLVGGIGIMNIMLVTVTERTREIGIRKALGARKRVVMSQFLAEAVMLGALGGVTGVLTGLVGSHFRIVGVRPVVSYPSVVLALAVSVAVSLFFGIYPANRAASMRPIDALRHE